MICLLLIMTMIFINNTESAEQKIRHSDTMLKEDMNTKTKAWLLMVESGKVDEEELRRITPKSIFIAPLLTNRVGKCKEGYRHDHLGQCVKVIKIDPKVQLELLLQRLNKLYGEQNEEKEEEKNKEAEKEKEDAEREAFEMSSGPLHFSLPISNSDEKVDQTTSEVKAEFQVPSKTMNTTSLKVQNVAEFIPVPLPYENQTKEIESSGAEPLNETESYVTPQYEGSGDGQAESGDGFQEEKSTTPFEVGLLSEETDYFDVTEIESTTVTEIYSTTVSPQRDFSTTEPTVKQDTLRESYQNITDTQSVNISKTINISSIRNSSYNNNNSNTSSTVLSKKIVKNNSNSEKIYFPSDDDNDGLRTSTKSSAYNNRIRFPEENSHKQIHSYHSLPELNSKPTKPQVYQSTNLQEPFWWLPKSWQIDENQYKSDLVKVWSRLPLIHDITYSREGADNFQNSASSEKPHPVIFSSQYTDESSTGQQQPPRILKPFKSRRFQDILLTPRQNFRFQR